MKKAKSDRLKVKERKEYPRRFDAGSTLPHVAETPPLAE